MSRNKLKDKPLQFVAEVTAFYAISGALRLIPSRWRVGFAGKVTKGLGASLGSLNRRIHANLAIGLPDLDEAKQKTISAEVWEGMGRAYAELTLGMAMYKGDKIRLVNFEAYERAQQQGRGVIFIGAHFGNWELTGVTLGHFTKDFHAFYRPHDNHVLDTRIKAMRGFTGTTLLSRKDPGSLRTALRVLKSGGGVGIFMDQRASKTERVPFLDVPASTISSPFSLARSTGAAVIPFYLRRGEGGFYEAIFENEVALPQTDDKAADCTAFLTSLNQRISAWIRKDPGQWLWLHNRWK